MNKRVAIFQNTITGGGRIRVIEEIIRILNGMDAVPDVITFRVNPSFQPNPDLDFRIRKVRFKPKGFNELKMPLLNLHMRLFEDKYDLLVNSNNSLLFAPNKTRTIAYIHFPREARVLSEYASLPFPDGKRASELALFSRAYRNALKLIYRFRSLPTNHTVITNSHFTKSMFLEAYPEVDSNEIEVIYPPINLDEWKNQFEKIPNTVTTLGRFSKDKRQLEQIQIAEELPHLKFNIIGFVGDKSSKKYFETCKSYIDSKQIENVRLRPNLIFDEMKEVLQASQFFMHNIRNEPFGISTVEGIAAGCIPIVHNSGGQKEIIPYEELRFEDGVDAIKVIKKLDSFELKLEKISRSIGKFDISEFRRKMLIIIGNSI